MPPKGSAGKVRCLIASRFARVIASLITLGALSAVPARASVAPLQTVFLDFDTFTSTASGEHSYSSTERTAIKDAMTDKYSAWSIGFTGTMTTGTSATVFFNARAPGTITTGTSLIGGDSSDVDFLNLDKGGTAEVNITNLLTDGPSPISGALAPTTANLVGLSAYTASHELGHLLGLRHWDSFGPPGSGLPPDGPAASTYSPAYPGPATASESKRHIMNPGPITGQTLSDAAGTTYFGEREAVRLSFNESGTVVPETTVFHGVAASAQALTLPAFSVPNTLKAGDANFGKILSADAVAVTGTIGLLPETDWYSFTGAAGDLLNMESVFPPHRFSDPSDLAISLFDSASPFATPLVTNTATFESGDPQILDYSLATSGTFYVKLSADPAVPASLGGYDLYIYRLKIVPEPQTCALLATTGLALLAWKWSRRRAS